jgi:MYXO-CTERM domain-containing protein
MTRGARALAALVVLTSATCSEQSVREHQLRLGTSCVGVPDGSACSLPCRSDGHCKAGVCTGGTISPAGTACASGNLCTLGDVCDQAGICQPGSTLISCDDGNPCTMDACEPMVGCTHSSICDAGMDAAPDAGMDAGHDAGMDAGHDAGTDAAHDAAMDAGTDAGHDAGTDAAHDAAMPDAGGPDASAHDAGSDAGKPTGLPVPPLPYFEGGSCSCQLGGSGQAQVAFLGVGALLLFVLARPRRKR